MKYRKWLKIENLSKALRHGGENGGW